MSEESKSSHTVPPRGNEGRATEPTSPVKSELMRMFRNWQFRPEPARIRQLVTQHNLQPSDIIEAGMASGYERPRMDIALEELRNILPTISELTDAVARIVADSESSPIVPTFLGRDAELLYDAYATRYGNQFGSEPVLFPASSGIWKIKIENKNRAFKNDREERKFLESYGITQQALRANTRFLLVDTGWAGSSGLRIRQSVSRIYGLSEEQVAELLPVKLVAHREGVLADLASGERKPLANTSQLIPDPRQAPDQEYRQFFPKAYYARMPFYRDYFGYITASLQTMPHFHDYYYGVVKVGGKRIGVPATNTRSVLDTNLDNTSYQTGSPINPVGALIVQSEVIKYMMGQRKS